MSLIELQNDFGSLVVSGEGGATVRSLIVNVAGREYQLLRGADENTMGAVPTPSGVGSFVMAPWANRIRLGRLVTAHGEFALPRNSGEHAIHGLVRKRAWQVVSQSCTEVVFRIELQPPWPFRGWVVQRLNLDRASVKLCLEVHAADGERVFPASLGWHPWFRRSLGSSQMTVECRAQAQWALSKEKIPDGTLRETALCERLRRGTRFTTDEVDDCFQIDPLSEVILRWPELVLRMKSSATVSHVMVYAPADAICVEPQTATVNAFQLAALGVANTGTQWVAPGKPLVGTSCWAWSRD